MTATDYPACEERLKVHEGGDYTDGVEDNPYSLLIFDPILAPEPSPWPKPVTYDWLPIQREYNTLRRQQIEAGKRAARKVLYDESTFPDADEAQKFLESAADMQGVRVTDIGRPPLVIGDGAQSPDVARNIPYLHADWQVITSSTPARLGNTDSGTATEAVIGEQSAAVRDSEARTLVIEWLTMAGSKMLQLVKQTLTLDIWIELKDFDDADFQEFLQSPGLQAYLGLRLGPENVPAFLQMLPLIPGAQEQLKQQFGQLKPLRVTRSQLQFEADVTVLPSTIRPIYRAQLLQLVSLLGPQLVLLSPTLIQELLASFELPQGDRIAEELLANLKQQAMALAAQQAAKGQAVPGTPNPQSAASPLGTQNPLGAVSGGRGV